MKLAMFDKIMAVGLVLVVYACLSRVWYDAEC